MPRFELGTRYIYTIRRTAELTVYRSSRNPEFLLKVRTLSMMVKP